MEEYLKKTDGELASLAMSGDQMAFRAIYERHQQAVRGRIGGFLQWKADVDDVVMESFQKAFLNLADFDTSRDLRPWLITIARRTALDHIERLRREQQKKENIMATRQDQADLSSEPLTETSPEDEIISGENHERLMAYLEELPPIYKEVMVKYMIDELEYGEIAKELSLELNTVRTRIRRGKQHLAEMMLRGEVE